MRSTLSICTLAAALAIPFAAHATPTTTPRYNTPRRPDLNAFVNHSVTDTRTLVSEVRKDPEVADRYMRLYGMSKDQVIGFLGTLHRENLQNAAEFTVWSAPPGVNFKQHQEVLRKGTPVFADSEGRPTLIVKCGNPLRVPHQLAILSPIPPTSTTGPEADLPGPRDVESEATNPLDGEMPIIPELAAPISVGPQDIVAMTIVPGVPNVARSLPYLGLAPLLAPIFGGSSSHGSIVIFPTPEPAPLVALGLGAIAMVRRRRRKA